MFSSMDVSVFPNPTTSSFKVQVITAGKEAISARILDIQGNIVKKLLVQPHQSLQVGEDLKAGIYMLEVIQGSERITKKIIKL